jgi:hypothetical protein
MPAVTSRKSDAARSRASGRGIESHAIVASLMGRRIKLIHNVGDRSPIVESGTQSQACTRTPWSGPLEGVCSEHASWDWKSRRGCCEQKIEPNFLG